MSLVQTTNRPRFAAPTPHPRAKPRLSHPLSQVYTPGLAEKDTSFISTASSHDLATHARANASFDPTTDIGAKFNHLKLNTYLHGLNKHLSEENKRLQGLLGQQQDVRGESASPKSAKVLSDIVQALQEDLAQMQAERDELRDEVEKMDEMAKEFRKRDENQEKQVESLELRVKKAEEELKRRTELHAKSAKELTEGAEAIINEMQAKLDNTEEQVKSLRTRLVKEGHEAERVREAEENAEALRDAKTKVEVELVKATREANDLKEQVVILGSSAAKLEGDVERLEDNLANERANVKRLQEEGEIRTSEDRKKLIALEAKLAERQMLFEQQDQEIQAMDNDLANAMSHEALMEEQVRQMEAALKESEEKLQIADEDIRVYRRKVEFLSKEREQAQLEAAHARAKLGNPSDSHEAEDVSSTSGSSTTVAEGTLPVSQAEHERIVSDLEAQLEDAEREIGRLEHAMKESPALEAIKKAKTMRIEALEADNKELQEQVTTLQSALQDIASTNPNTRTPMKGNASFGTMRGWTTPSLLKTPRTPGGALRDLSWLQNASISGSVDIQPYVARIQELHEQLDEAGENLDQMVNELGEAGLSVVKLTEALQASRGRVDELEKEVGACKRSEDRIRKRLQRCKCGQCGRRFDASNLLQVNHELTTLRSQWAAEKQAHINEKTVLRDAASRLNAEIKVESGKLEQERRKANEDAKRIQNESEREKEMLQMELDRARKSILAIESDLREERNKLRSINTEQKRVEREKANIVAKLSQTEAHMTDVREELQKAKRVSRKLESELREQSGAEEKIQELTKKFSGNQALLDTLRSERDTLIAEQAELQRKFTKATEDTEAIRNQLSKSQAAHNDRRHQLDLRATEVEDLRLQLQEQAVELHDAELEKNRLAKERMEVARTITTLEADLKRVRRDAENIRKDVALLKNERAGLLAKTHEDKLTIERAQAHVRQMHSQLVEMQRKVREVEESRTASALDSEALEKLKLVHNKECKGLMLQIRYLKARCTREHAFRLDLGYQKVYLLKVLEAHNVGERSILASIARLGFPPPKRTNKSLRTIVMAVIFVHRTKTAREAWLLNVASKQAVQGALEEVRKRRATQKS
ncbi:uncharacterized protein EI90DRAFT_3186603 [Cantharellus anzutake]|uniref:uncharacterized protein n=2 Tax=Cantharellus anzutake TaxID=1750568 RepID=UPI001908631D|nr:uncharacterized protein EI90DRAFT_3186603 [Cantharellus anzutake]KAF8312563.1 hypothetical protein EI90DRAFT_3186603 [Cantharellus anzutake]